MKTILSKVAVAAVAVAFISLNCSAQDALKANPDKVKLLTDTGGVRMLKVTLAPGEELAYHTHPLQMMYCLQGGQVTVNYKNGKKEVFDIKEGDAMSAPADPPHTTTNTGSTTISFLELEIHGKKTGNPMANSGKSMGAAKSNKMKSENAKSK